MKNNKIYKKILFLTTLMPLSIQAMDMPWYSEELDASILGKCGSDKLSDSLKTLKKCRLICQRWNRLLHDKQVLQNFFNTLELPELSDEQMEAIQIYLVTIAAARTFNQKEIWFLNRLRSYMQKKPRALAELIGGEEYPLRYVSTHNALESVRCLLVLGAATMLEPNKETPLHVAASQGHTKIVRLLLEYNVPLEAEAEDNALEDYENCTALHLAVAGGHIGLAQLLIRRGANKEAAEILSNQRPLHIAVDKNNFKMTKMLLALGCDLEAEAWNGNRPLHIAAQWASKKIIRLLLRHGAEMEATNGQGHTPLHEASGAADSYSCKNVQLLLENGANIEAASNGWRALHYAVAFPENEDLVELLLRYGAQRDARKNDGRIPLHIAAARKNAKKLISLLLSKDTIETEDNDGYTPLHCATQDGNIEAVKILLAHNASTDAKTKEYSRYPMMTPLEIVEKKLTETKINHYCDGARTWDEVDETWKKDYYVVRALLTLYQFDKMLVNLGEVELKNPSVES